MAYIGLAPGVSSQRMEDTFTATAGQTSFVPSSGYVPGNIDVYRNGVKLANGLEFTASDGITVVLNNACAAGDSVVLLSYIPRGLSDGYTKPEADSRYFAQSSSMGFRNRIINGDMRIDQRNNGAAVTIPAAVTYVLDRWLGFSGNANRFSIQRNAGGVTPPAGFTNYLGATSLSAYSAASGDAFLINQYIEGFNVADLAWGTANAQAFTLSFWVRSSLAGTFSTSFTNAVSTRVYVATYTVNAANTWEYKTITVPGDTAGTWATDNSIGLQVRFDLGSGAGFQAAAGAWGTSNVTRTSGSQSVVGTNGATFYITGVQLEKGSVATPFEFRSYGQELALCQRYYEKSFNVDIAPANGVISTDRKQGVCYDNSSTIGYFARFCVTKRSAPSIVLYKGANAGTNGQWSYFTGSAWTTMTTTGTVLREAEFMLDFSASGGTFGQSFILDGNWAVSAEL